MEPAPDLVF